MKLTADIKVGDTLHFSGHDTDFQQTLTSMQLDHVSVETASSGTAVGIKLKERMREGTDDEALGRPPSERWRTGPHRGDARNSK